jgi:ABC-type multidrug transport system fused ATPase/permease subunit
MPKQKKKFWFDLWRMIEPSHRKIKKLFGLILLFEAARMISPYILKIVIDQLMHFQSENIGLILELIGLMFLAGQLDSLIGHFKDRQAFAVLIDIEYYLPVRIYRKLMELSLNYHERENTGNKITKIERGINKISDLLANIFWEVTPTLVQLAFTLIVLLAVDWRFGASYAVFAPLFILLTYKVNKDLYPVRKKRHKNYEIASGKMGQAIININTVKSFVQEENEIRKFSRIREKIRVNELKEWYRLLNFGLVRNLIIDLGRITMLLLAAYFVWNKSISMGTLVFVITLSEKAYFSLWRLSRFYDKTEEGAEAVRRFMDVLAEPVEIKNPKNGFKPKRINGLIEFKNVSFAYRDGQLALDNVSLKIEPDCVTALVGPSGGGKTTVARMIYRHYDPQKGKILLDKRDLREYDLYALRKFIAIVPQEVEIFNGTVKENIAYAKPNASEAEIKAAAAMAYANEFIEKLPAQYKTEVGERGIKLSGGQRQRIGIARAVLANPRILIFDEATSNLDSQSEMFIQKAMEKISRQRTIIIIAHRLSTIKKADKIIVLESGRVVESGSHYELAAKRTGLYARLLKLQKLGEVN